MSALCCMKSFNDIGCSVHEQSFKRFSLYGQILGHDLSQLNTLSFLRSKGLFSGGTPAQEGQCHEVNQSRGGDH